MFAKYGHAWNFAKGKSEAVVRLYGPTAPRAWLGVIQAQDGCPTLHTPQHRHLRIAPICVHLGLLFTKTHTVGPDVVKRVQEGEAALTVLTRHVLMNGSISKSLRVYLVRVFLMSRMLYGVEAWSCVSNAAMAKLER